MLAGEGFDFFPGAAAAFVATLLALERRQITRLC